MMRFADTIAGRTILVLVLGLGSTLLLAQYLYQNASEREVIQSNANRVAERLLVLADTITSVSSESRDETAHRLSGGPLELHWSEQPLAIAGGTLDAGAEMLRQYLIERAPDLKSRGLIFGTSGTGGDTTHTTLISLGLKDNTWLNVTLARVQSTQINAPSFIVSMLVGTMGIIAVSILLGRWLTEPLNRLAREAGTLFIANREGSQLDEQGTREVRTLAVAINEMQRRIEHMVADRTQMLAAISHDLRTPLTRLKLRADRLPDGETKGAINRDIAEMEQMIDSTLGFLRENADREPLEAVDLVAIIQTIVDDAADAGQDVFVDIPRSLVVRGRHLALKRAVSNLVNNALRYGKRVRISVQQSDSEVAVVVSDDGPGIPQEMLDAAFDPFKRLDEARGPNTGGYGLGLTVARAVARSHGGDTVLTNRPHGGLDAILKLPHGEEEPAL